MTEVIIPINDRGTIKYNCILYNFKNLCSRLITFDQEYVEQALAILVSTSKPVEAWVAELFGIRRQN